MRNIIFPILGVIFVIVGILLMVEFLRIFLKSFIGLILIMIGVQFIFSSRMKGVVHIRRR